MPGRIGIHTASDQQIGLGGYILKVALPRNRRTPGRMADVRGYGSS